MGFMIYTRERMKKHDFKDSFHSAGVVRPLCMIDVCIFDLPWAHDLDEAPLLTKKI